MSPESSAASALSPRFEVPVDVVRLSIEGMTCATCSQRIENVLRKQDGVVSAQVNLATEVATVALPGGEESTARLIEAVKRAGYGAAPYRQRAP